MALVADFYSQALTKLNYKKYFDQAMTKFTLFHPMAKTLTKLSSYHQSYEKYIGCKTLSY